MHLSSFEIALICIIRNKKMKKLVRISALLKNNPILLIMVIAKRDQFMTGNLAVYGRGKMLNGNNIKTIQQITMKF